MSSHRKSSMNNSIKDRLEEMKEWILEHTKIVMPVVLLVCVLITVLIALNANKKAAAEVEALTVEPQKTAAAEDDTQAIPDTPLEENAYPAVNSLMNAYYEAMAAGDIDSIVSMNEFIDEKEKIRLEAVSRYIESYPELTVYTKPGPIENSYLVYAYSKVKFSEYDKLVPGMQAFYVCTDENGNCYINEGEDNSVITEYIRSISLQDDVVELNNKVAVEYNELVESDEEVAAFLVDVSARIDVSVGEALAKAESAADEAQDAEAAEAVEGTEAADGADNTDNETDAQEADAQTPAATVKTVRATDVVNVRSSDSETADKLGKAQTGDEFTLLEERGNGWSKITFEGKDAFIKSEYLEVVSEEEAPAPTEQAEETEDNTPAASTGDGKTVTVIENVNVRKSASENGEKLGLAYIGEKLELVMKQADGWTKVKYKGETAYVKSDFVE